MMRMYVQQKLKKKGKRVSIQGGLHKSKRVMMEMLQNLAIRQPNLDPTKFQILTYKIEIIEILSGGSRECDGTSHDLEIYLE